MNLVLRPVDDLIDEKQAFADFYRLDMMRPSVHPALPDAGDFIIGHAGCSIPVSWPLVANGHDANAIDRAGRRPRPGDRFRKQHVESTRVIVLLVEIGSASCRARVCHYV